MFEEAAEIGKLLHRADEFLEIFETARGVGGLLLAPQIRIAGFFQNDFGEFALRLRLDQLRPARKIGEQASQSLALLGLQLLRLDHGSRGLHQGDARAPCMIMEELQGGVTEAALRQVKDALESKIIGGLRDTAKIRERVADLGALVKSRAADHPVGQAKGDEPLLEFAHLEGGADQNGDLIERVALALQLLDLLADHAGFFFRVPNAGDGRLLAQFAIGEERFAEASFVMRNQARGDREDMPGRAVIAFEPDDFRARKIALETQDVIDLGAAPAIDRLIIVADAADVLAPLREQPQPQILGRVGVLIFIDEHIAEAVLIEF